MGGLTVPVQVRYGPLTATATPTEERTVKITTPAATCTKGHTHVSWYAAQECSRDLAPVVGTQRDLTAAERTALTGLPCSA